MSKCLRDVRRHTTGYWISCQFHLEKDGLQNSDKKWKQTNGSLMLNRLNNWKLQDSRGEQKQELLGKFVFEHGCEQNCLNISVPCCIAGFRICTSRFVANTRTQIRPVQVKEFSRQSWIVYSLDLAAEQPERIVGWPWRMLISTTRETCRSRSLTGQLHEESNLRA